MADTFLPISIENFHITTPSDLPSEFINDNQVNDQVTATQIRTLIDVKMAEIQTDMAAKMRTLQTGMKNDFASVTAKIVEHVSNSGFLHYIPLYLLSQALLSHAC